MNRRRFPLTTLAGVLAAPRAAEAQQAGKISRAGILVVGYGGALVQSNTLPAFFEGLRDLGWVEGQNIAFERRVAVDAGQSLA